MDHASGYRPGNHCLMISCHLGCASRNGSAIKIARRFRTGPQSNGAQSDDGPSEKGKQCSCLGELIVVSRKCKRRIDCRNRIRQAFPPNLPEKSGPVGSSHDSCLIVPSRTKLPAIHDLARRGPDVPVKVKAAMGRPARLADNEQEADWKSFNSKRS